MRIYVDEAGSFVPPKSPLTSFSLVLALIIPAEIESDLFYQFLRLRDAWPNQSVEIKGSTLDESQAAQLINLVQKYDVLVQFIALDTNTHPTRLVEDFKITQADAITANITREHHPNIILQLYQLGETIRKMPNQLFLQAFATQLLIIKTIREGTLYYVQRQPRELGDISWVVDRKDKLITEMEKTWSTMILPLSESAFAKEPFAMEGEDYSHFEARYGFTEKTANPEMLRHVGWLRSAYGKPSRPKNSVNGIYARRLLTEQLTFQDSRDSLGLQLTDMLAAILRRALNDRLQVAGWGDFGSLLVRKRQPADGFIQLGPGGNNSMPSHANKVCRALDRKAKDMLAERNRKS